MYKFFAIFLIFFSIKTLAEPCQPVLPIINKPILFDAKRIELTKDYLREHYGISSENIEMIPQIIVLHWTATQTFEQAYQTFYPATLGDSRPELPGDLNVSAHFLVDRDGKIFQLMPDQWVGRHVIGLNYTAIGIENVGGATGLEDLTLKQIQANAYLVCYLKQKYPSIKYLIGHMEYLQFRNTALWKEKNPNYYTIKPDPGRLFMEKVRKLTANLGLHSI